MIKFSESTAIALHAMIYIANRANKIVSLNEIADAFAISANHLSKVLQRLTKAGYLASIKGPKGGFQIVTKNQQITFLDVYTVIEGKHVKRNCLFSAKATKCRNCIMRGLVSKLNTDFYSYMATNKITDFKL